MRQKKNVTFDDIAKYTNFSKTTISRYFNNPDSLTLENQEIIAKALVDLDYKENKVARILASGKTEYIGIVVPNMFINYYSEMLNQILGTYETFGYKFLVFTVNDNPENERKYIQELLSYKIEGLIILSYTIPSEELASYHVPVVTIEREDTYVSSVNTDNYQGAIQATSLLAEKGCDILLHINSIIPQDRPAHARIKGFEDYCTAHGLAHEVLYRKEAYTYKDSLETMKELFDEIETKYKGRKKGIFVSGDTFANMLLNLIVRKYSTLPEEYQIVGFDNAPISGEAVYPISTVDQQIGKIAHEAVKLLVEQMNERKKRRPVLSDEPVHKIVSTVLIERETTR